MDSEKNVLFSDAAWYCCSDPEEKRFYEMFFGICRKHRISWASASQREKTFVEEVTRVTYERDRANRLGLPLEGLPPEDVVDPHGEKSVRNIWSRKYRRPHR